MKCGVMWFCDKARLSGLTIWTILAPNGMILTFFASSTCLRVFVVVDDVVVVIDATSCGL